MSPAPVLDPGDHAQAADQAQTTAEVLNAPVLRAVALHVKVSRAINRGEFLWRIQRAERPADAARHAL